MLPYLSSLQSIADAITEAQTNKKLLLLKFGAQWCKPCKMIAPITQSLVQEHREQVTGYEIDVDVVKESLTQFNVSSLPTFILIWEGNVRRTWKGSNPEELHENLFQELELLQQQVQQQQQQQQLGQQQQVGQ